MSDINDTQAVTNLTLWTAQQQLLTRYDLEVLKGRSPEEAARLALIHLELLLPLLPANVRATVFDSASKLLEIAQRVEQMRPLPDSFELPLE